MKKIYVLFLALSLNVYAHDEGHGPKLTDAPKMGGVVASVVLAKEASKGSKAELLYKGELARTSDGSVRIYYYDKDMNKIDLAAFSEKASAEVITSRRGKVETQTFELVKHGDHYMGKMPTPARKPFNIDVKTKSADKELLVAFDNLD